MNTISVILVTYARSEGLDATMASLEKQTYPVDEIIICDDYSPDNTKEIGRRWEKRMPNVKYVRNDANMGMPANLNNGMQLATGDLIINLHDGDTYSPEMVERVHIAFQQEPDVGLVFWAAVDNWQEKRGIATVTPGRQFFLKHFFLSTSSKIWGTTAVRREVYNELMPFNDRFGAWADIDMWMRVCLQWDIYYISDPLMDLYDAGPFRKWNWDKALNIQDMFFLNICRHFDCAKARRGALKKQLNIRRKQWLRFMFGRIRHRQFGSLFKGLQYMPRYFHMPAIVDEFEAGEF